MEQREDRRFRVSIARVLAWVAILALSLTAFRPDTPLAVVWLAPLCWCVLAWDLARVLFPGVFRTRTLREVFRGDLPEARTLGLRETTPGPLVPIGQGSALPWMTPGEMAQRERSLVEAGFDWRAARFVLSALRLADSETSPVGGGGVQPEAGRTPDHTTAAGLCASIRRHARTLAGDGHGANALLDSLGLRRGEDAGRLVEALIEFGFIERREGESLDEFHGLPLLEEEP